MKKLILITGLLTIFLNPVAMIAGGRGCTGSASCTACKNCSGCKHCAKEGGTCGVCSRSSSGSNGSAPVHHKSTKFKRVKH